MYLMGIIGENVDSIFLEAEVPELFLFFPQKSILLIYGCRGSLLLQGLSLVAVSRGYPSLQCLGFSLWWFLLLQSTGAGVQASVVVAHGLRCSTARGILPD